MSSQEGAINAFKSTLGKEFNQVSDLSQWQPFDKSQAWFSHFHCKANFSLPYLPAQWLFSGIVMIPVNLDRNTKPFAYYKRGISKYRRQIQKGEAMKPITILWGNNRSHEGLSKADGNHRYRAAWEENLPFIPAVLGIRKTLLINSNGEHL